MFFARFKNKLMLYTKFRKFRKIYKIILIILFLICLFYGFRLANLSQAQRVAFVKNSKTVQSLLPAWREVRKISDIFYFPYYFKSHNFETYKLIVEPDTLKKMENNLPKVFSGAIMTDEFKDWYKALLVAPDGAEYKVEIRYRGDKSIHWDSPKKSISISLSGGKAYQGMKKLNFILPDDRNFVLEELLFYQAKKMNLPSPKSDFAFLEINNKKQGFYFVVEGWDEAFLAYNEFSEESNLFGMSEGFLWLGQFSSILDDLRRWNKYTNDLNHEYDDYSTSNMLLKFLNETSDEYFYNNFFNLVDKDNFFSWIILQEIMNSGHQTSDNLRIIFDSLVGKLKFVPWDVGIFPPPDGGVKRTALINRVLTQPENMHKRNVMLWNYINSDNGINDDLSFFDKKWQEIKVAVYQDRNKIYNNLHASNLVKSIRNTITTNVKYYIDQLKAARVLIYLRLNPNQEKNKLNQYNLESVVEFYVDNYSELAWKNIDLDKLDLPHGFEYSIFYDKDKDGILTSRDLEVATFDSGGFKSNNLEQVLLYSERESGNGLKEPLIIKKTKHSFFITSKKSDNEYYPAWFDLKFKIENSVTKYKLTNDDIEIKIIDESVFADFDLIGEDWSTIKNKYSFLSNTLLDDNKIIFNGVYYIPENVIIPKGYEVVIMPGTRFVLADKVSIYSYSPVSALGMAAAPIVFTAQNKNFGWGNFVVVNSGDNKNSFRNCVFEYGGSSTINGVSSTGMLSVFNSKSEIEECIFRYSFGDDGLNIKKGESYISKNLFYQNNFDALDLDWTDSIVDGNILIDNKNDGIDLSAGAPIIRNNYIYKSGDKGVSIGENSRGIIYNNIISGSVMGIASKDLSEPKIINNNIINNQTGIAAYQKKEIFGGSQPKLYNNIFYNNLEDYSLDKLSFVDFNYDLYSESGKNIDLECDGYGFCAGDMLDKKGKFLQAVNENIEYKDKNIDDNFYLGVFNIDLIKANFEKYRYLIKK